MSKLRETSTDKDLKDLGTDFIDDRKPDWVDHAHLDAPLEESLANRLIYKVKYAFFSRFFRLYKTESQFPNYA